MKNGINKLNNEIFKFFLNLIPSKYIRAKLKAERTKNFIKKYADFAIKNSVEPKNKEYNEMPPVFQYWEQGIENAPLAVKKCINSIKKFEPERKQIILDFKTVEDYVEIPSFIYDLKKRGKISITQFSDILRTCLLAETPCIWVDSTILLTGPFPKYITESDFFIYKGIKKTPENFAGANFFIASKTPNLFTVQLKEAILNYWKNNDFLISYFMHPHMISLIANKNKDFWDKIPTVDEQLTLQLSKVLFKKFDPSYFEEIKSRFPIHKTTYKAPRKLKCGINETYFAKILESINE